MSLLRLLTTGKSLVGVRDTESRYRVTSQRLLPQFGSARNPFSSTGEIESRRRRQRIRRRIARGDGASERRCAGFRARAGARGRAGERGAAVEGSRAR